MFDHETFDRLLLPAIERYASHVHLLPASAHHHHKGAGGLLRHGLEVGFFAVRAAHGHIFTPDATPLERKRSEIRWAFFGGLLHDVGKPITDLAVVNEDGTLTWSPFLHGIAEWDHQNGLSRFYLRWRDRRHRNHELVGSQAVELSPVPGAATALRGRGRRLSHAPRRRGR